ncbi:MAG: DegT/DnrJ/EryC1/StrS family aminotransferase [Pirellulales bacterium]
MNDDTRSSVIPAFSTERAWRAIKSELHAALDRVLETGQAILGNEVHAFELEFADFTGTQHAISTASGTDALIIAMKACGVGYGDEVITVANGPVPIASAVRALGAIPVFHDIDSQTWQIRAETLVDSISPRTRCILVVHLYGWHAPVEAIVESVRGLGISVVEDFAHAHGMQRCAAGAKPEPIGLQGDVGCYSFYPTKNLGAVGDGGACVTDSADRAALLRAIARYGFRDSQRIAHVDGINSRLDELQAAFLRVRLSRLEADVRRRREIADRYRRELSGCGLQMPFVSDGALPAWHLFPVRTAQREDWLRMLEERGIHCGIHYAHPLHLMPAFAASTADARNKRSLRLRSLPDTEAACREVFSLPLFTELLDAEVSRVIDAVRATSSLLVQ